MKVKREREVAQSCSTLPDPMDCSLPGSSAHGIFQARGLEWVAIAFSGNVSLGRYIPKYFILFVTMVNGIVSLISLSVFSLLVYRNARDFCVSVCILLLYQIH